MRVETINRPFTVRLAGVSGHPEGACFGEKGRELMDRLWAEVKRCGLATHGVNHWVYLADGGLFTGVEIREPAADLGSLATMEIQIPRYLRHVHVGPYSELPNVWASMTKKAEEDGETRSYPGLEIYGHWNEDPGKCETTVLIALERKVAGGA